MPCDFNFVFTPTGSTVEIKLNGTAELILSNVALKDDDAAIHYDSKTQLLEGMDADGEITGNLYNECISYGDLFQLPVTAATETLILSLQGGTIVEDSLIYNFLYY